jgi:hypothetical protein
MQTICERPLRESGLGSGRWVFWTEGSYLNTFWEGKPRPDEC